MSDSPVRVLIADDSALMRQTLRRVLERAGGFELLGTARDGEDAVAKARELRPDVVTMDVNMPRLDGISALQLLVHERLCPVVMVSSLTQAGALTTLECLELGAFDYVGKPDGTVSGNLDNVAGELVAKLRAAARAGLPEVLQARRARLQDRPHPPARPAAPRRDGMVDRVVTIGVSTGGPATLQEVLPRLPADLPAAVLLVQHMPPAFIPSFARRLDEHAALRVVVAEEGMPLEAGTVFVAPGQRQLAVDRRGGRAVLRTPAEPRTLFMPSAGEMMRSVREAYGAAAVGVLMTGIGDDGAEEMARLRAVGGHTIAESEASCVVFGMPRRAIELGGAAEVRPSWEIADAIVRAVARPLARAS
ncbi:MAG: chemotaxis response regulator protein-glutamate methylesterase [Gemmatimonadales bacterium]|nr:chemotaxis response regulator protein-glutamate methylesterase [Gemmatimonadales bacterium]